jgi:membrane protease YdiL (CAAX protease family)
VRARDIPSGFALGVVLQAVAVPLLYAPLFWLWKSLDNDDVSHNARQLTDAAHGLGLVVLVLVLVVGAPIVEEIFFRGLVMRSLARRIGAAWAVPVQALVFAGAHLEGIEFPALLLFGLVAGVLARRTGRLGPSIAAHMGFNAFTVFALVALHWG